MAIEDFGRAHENYVKYYEVCSLLYGENDRRSNEARGLVQVKGFSFANILCR